MNLALLKTAFELLMNFSLPLMQIYSILISVDKTNGKSNCVILKTIRQSNGSVHLLQITSKTA